MIDKIEKYYELKQQEKELKEEIEKLNKEIKHWMLYTIRDKSIKKGEYKIRVAQIDFRKFTDDIIPFLKINGFEDLIEVKEVFDYEKLKKLIKSGKISPGSVERFRDNKGKKSTNLYVRKVTK